MLAQPLYAISALARPTTSEGHDEASILRYLRLFVSVTTEYGESLSHDDRTTQLVHTSDRARLQRQAAINVKLLVESIKEGAMALLDAGSIDLVRHQVVDKFLNIVAYGRGRFLSHAVQASGAFDFSLAIAAFELIKRSVAEPSPGLTNIVRNVVAVEEVISLKSGTGLMEIWRTLSSKPQNAESRLDDLEASDGRVPFALNDPKLRAQHLVEAGTGDDDMKQEIDMTYIFAQLRALVAVSRSPTESHLVIQDLIDDGCSNREVSLTTLVPYRQLLWASDARESVIEGLMHAHILRIRSSPLIYL
ncbi:hypothetical protein C8T65DRAFT_738483 [Cerioporus squamosus]|nr:hypothetical protein C8T65DRAFT_738483 [Cerioporus squamosus]